MRLIRLTFLFATAALLSRQTTAADAGSPGQVEFLRAVTQSPALTAAWRRTAAARERVDASGRLADVEVEGMGSRMVGPMDERATMWELNVRQPLPKRGERAADRDRARAAVAMAQADYAVMAGEVAADIASALAEAEGAEARAQLLETQAGRLDSVLKSLETRLGVGTARLADRLTVQTRIASMQLMIEEERRMAEDAFAEVRGRLGLPPSAPLPDFAAPLPTQIQPDDAAALRVAAARVDEAGAMAKMARASANPMTAVGVRFEQERRAMGDENTLGLAFMSEIPWRSRRYARAEVRAAEAERDAAQTEATAARHRIAAALTRVDRAERVAATARRLKNETLGRLHAEHDTMLRAASASAGAMGGDSTVLHAVEILEKSTDTELQVLRAETAVRVARAELWRYAPATQLSLNQP